MNEYELEADAIMAKLAAKKKPHPAQSMGAILRDLGYGPENVGGIKTYTKHRCPK